MVEKGKKWEQKTTKGKEKKRMMARSRQKQDAVKQEAYITVWIQKAPSTILQERLWILVNRLHDLGPVQALDSFSVLDVTRTVATNKHVT